MSTPLQVTFSTALSIASAGVMNEAALAVAGALDGSGLPSSLTQSPSSVTSNQLQGPFTAPHAYHLSSIYMA